MTTKELKKDLESGTFPEKEQLKQELVYEATYALTSNIRTALVNTGTLKEKTENFLKHKHFRDALMNELFSILEHKENSHHLRRGELKILIDETASAKEYKEVVEKIHEGIIACINEDPENKINLALQAILSKYMDNLETKLSTEA